MNYTKFSESIGDLDYKEKTVPQEKKKDTDKKEDKTVTNPKNKTDKKSEAKKDKKESTVKYPTLLEVIRGQNNENINTK
ncbi:hypothetical protein [Flammeovirga kamogawensis]|uniref:hypothetical protein n=1 Tax=Flammeovirga kamogawensis TaxID=373891 RepID=UPI001183A27D|nr:hypothetical protein [Flammeovirga kamogawensis]MBB6460153.1 hypothetical protein [Flammeovirga kamogawensis]TRX65473.1 hypothetical protein EO216_23420 [Flammeovirga kamogawensis]